MHARSGSRVKTRFAETDPVVFGVGNFDGRPRLPAGRSGPDLFLGPARNPAPGLSAYKYTPVSRAETEERSPLAARQQRHCLHFQVTFTGEEVF